jgi:hypothetical protein
MYPGTWNAFSDVGIGLPWLNWWRARKAFSWASGGGCATHLDPVFKGIIRVSQMNVQLPVHEAWKKVSHELNETDVTCHNIVSTLNTIQLEPVSTGNKSIITQQPLQETATKSRHCPTRNKEPHNTKKAESNTTQRKTHHNTADKFSSPPNLNLVATSQCCHQSSNRRGWHFHLQHLFPASAPV